MANKEIAKITNRLSHMDELIFDHSFATLPPQFFTRVVPTPMPAPYLVASSPSAAAMIGIDHAAFSDDDFIVSFVGNHIPAKAQPLAAVYSGHQFGVWAGQLGDGRAILLGDVASKDGVRMELQLKGAGRTPYSRMGDGRAVLRSSIREFLCSEAMAALGIPTSRALCIMGSDLPVMRETVESAAVVTRMAPSFIRFGSFEHWTHSTHNNHQSALQTLSDYVIDQFYPALRDAPQPYVALLREVTRRTAHLVAQWQAVGFMHGVLNTDNMSILGLTLDYGPFGFMEAFDPHHICNHSDQHGRYAYHMQPQIGYWNCYALGQALLPLIGDVEEAQAALAIYPIEYKNKIDALWHAKLGLTTQLPDDDQLIANMFSMMQSNHVDFTQFFRRLSQVQTSNVDNNNSDTALRDSMLDRAAFDSWAAQYRQRLQQENSVDKARKEAMNSINPKYVLRNYLAQIAIEKAQNKDFSEIETLLNILSRPYDEQPEAEQYAALPPDWASHLEVSCSS